MSHPVVEIFTASLLFGDRPPPSVLATMSLMKPRAFTIPIATTSLVTSVVALTVDEHLTVSNSVLLGDEKGVVTYPHDRYVLPIKSEVTQWHCDRVYTILI